MACVAAIRADLYNTSALGFQQRFEPSDFMPGALDLEQRIYALIEKGYTPSAAAAIVTSKQSNSEKLHVITQDNRRKKAG